MRKSVLVVVSDGFGGYGDFFFALKLAKQMQCYYDDSLGDQAPKVQIITQPSGQYKIWQLNDEEEFAGVEVLTPYQLMKQVKEKKTDVVSIVMGPVFLGNLMTVVDRTLTGVAYPIPLTLVPEYGFSRKQGDMTEKRLFCQRELKNIRYEKTIYTGFSQETNEKGILLSDRLIHPDKPEKLVEQLHPRLRSILFNERSINAYRSDTELFFQYSHDTHFTIPTLSAAIRFLEIHRLFVKNNHKNQDVLMVGKDRDSKRAALERVKKKLIADGYARISFYNADKNEEDVLYDSGRQGKYYRVVYTSAIPYSSMMAAQALSGGLIGATGDQSFGQAVSGDNIIIYECLEHKVHFRNAYYKVLENIDPDCRRVIRLLGSATSEKEFKELDKLLDDAMKKKLKALNKKLREKNQLVQHVAIAAMPVDDLCQKIIQNEIDPFGDQTDKCPPLERAFNAENYSALSHVIASHIENSDKREQFCELLMKKNYRGESHLAVLRRNSPKETTTKIASYLVVVSAVKKYKVKSGSEREVMYHAFEELITTFSALDVYHEGALIGLMLLTVSDISSEYRFFSPKKRVFGSQFYSNLENVLKELGINLKTITPEQKYSYYRDLATLMRENSHLFANEYILRSLSCEAEIMLPSIPPLISANEVQRLLESPSKQSTDHTVFYSQSGLYKRHFDALGHGNFGDVYIARHYSFDIEKKLVVSKPLAIKAVGCHNAKSLNKEAQLFQKAYPSGYFERFDRGDRAYLVMPFFTGIPLSRYLREHSNLSHEHRSAMVRSLFESLASIHVKGVTHNDLKPQNLLYDPNTGKIQIIDFGCAEAVGVPMHYSGFENSVFAFEMPPEYLNGCKANASMDIYSLTPTIAEILGINRKAIVMARIEKAFTKMKNNQSLKQAIVQAYKRSSGLFGDALFSPLLDRFRNTKDFQTFVECYVKEPYDFSPYREKLDVSIINLLDKMQTPNSNDRPTAAEIFEFMTTKESIIQQMTAV